VVVKVELVLTSLMSGALAGAVAQPQPMPTVWRASREHGSRPTGLRSESTIPAAGRGVLEVMGEEGGGRRRQRHELAHARPPRGLRRTSTR